MPDILLNRVYKRGRAKRAALESALSGTGFRYAIERIGQYQAGDIAIDDPGLENDYKPHHVNRGSIVKVILEQWAKHLVSEGKRIDEHIDELMVGSIALPFKWPTLPTRSEDHLTSVLDFRGDLRAYERDVEDFLEEVSMKAWAKIDVLPVTQMLNQLQRTYDRAYDVCALKVTTITNTWMATASLIVAMAAAIIAVVGIFSS